MNLAPIVLFCYNRPEHVKNVLNSLAKNKLASESLLYIYCDGPKINTSEQGLFDIELVRRVCRSENRFLDVKIIENNTNLGLANSIIKGVTEVVKKHGKIIVLEDDIVPEKGFLCYMNSALNMYENNEEVGCIHAWNYTFTKNFIKDNTFFLLGGDCWGWATWKRGWELFEKDGNKLKVQIDNNSIFLFNRKGTHAFYQMLVDQIEGKNNSWAILWHASLFLANKYCLHPKYPIVKNIGLDGTGTHSGVELLVQKTVKKIKIKKKDTPKENLLFYKSFDSGLQSKINLWENLKKKFCY